jgi:hypothetical protein
MLSWILRLCCSQVQQPMSVVSRGRSMRIVCYAYLSSRERMHIEGLHLEETAFNLKSAEVQADPYQYLVMFGLRLAKGACNNICHWSWSRCWLRVCVMAFWAELLASPRSPAGAPLFIPAPVQLGIATDPICMPSVTGQHRTQALTMKC